MRNQLKFDRLNGNQMKFSEERVIGGEGEFGNSEDMLMGVE